MFSNCGVREGSWESLGDSQGVCMEIKSVNPKGNHSWIFIGGTNAEAEAAILWPPCVRSQLIGKDPDTGRDWRQEEKGVIEDQTVK